MTLGWVVWVAITVVAFFPKTMGRSSRKIRDKFLEGWRERG